MQCQRFFSLFDTFSFRLRDQGNYKESAACPITKARNRLGGGGDSYMYMQRLIKCSLFRVQIKDSGVT